MTLFVKCIIPKGIKHCTTTIKIEVAFVYTSDIEFMNGIVDSSMSMEWKNRYRKETKMNG